MKGRSILVSCAALLLVPAAASAQFHPPPHPPPGGFSCTASAVRIELLALEPFVANKANAPCADDSKGLINFAPTGSPLQAKVLYADTDADPGGQPGARSEAGAAFVQIGTGAQSISVTALSANANASCDGDHPALSGSSQVVGLTVGGKPVIVTGNPQTIPLGLLGTIFLNEKVVSGGTITTRALRYEGLLKEIVVGEAKADFEGDPCP